MWILGVETSAGEGGVALLRDGRPAGLRSLGKGARAGLVPAVESLLKEAGIAPADLSLAAVDAGPGSFTGTRVAVAFAKALGYAAGVPLAAVSGLEARAAEAAADGTVSVVLDARRGCVYAALFRSEGGRLLRLMDDCLLPEGDVPGADLRLTLQVPALKQEIVVRGEVKRCVELPARGGLPPTFELGVSIFQAGLEYHDFLELLKTNHMLRLGDV